jgi:hypothetical protein
MAMGSLTLACALLLANADLPEVCHWSQSSFAIPIRFAADKRSSIKELRLYVSRDQGATWALEDRATPDKSSFRYTTSTDGQYWFIVVIIDQQNHQDPVDIWQAPVGLRMLVDTRKPEINLARAERNGDDVRVQWDIREDNPDLRTFRLEYRTADQATLWTPVNSKPALQGETSFRVATPGAVQVRILMNDLAGNVGQAEREVTGTGVAGTFPPEAVAPGPGTVPPPPGFTDTPPIPQPAPIGTPIGEYRPSPPVESAPRPQYRGEDTLPGRQTMPAPIPVPAPGQVPVASSQIQPTSGFERQSSAVTQYPPPQRGGLPAIELVNKGQAKIEFQIGKYGPSGLGSVDVYATSDDGATWTLASTDHNVTLPTPAEMRGGTPVAGSVMVDLREEGVVHGFYIVVKSRAGLGKKAPEPGTPPQVRIEMDITPPSVEMYKPQPDPKRRDTLLLSWRATDKNLANNPVTIEWAAQKEGPWNVIGTPDMPNSGQFSWPVAADVPPSVYLRLAVRDAAGNRAVALTQEPELVDLSVPEPVGFRVAK